MDEPFNLFTQVPKFVQMMNELEPEIASNRYRMLEDIKKVRRTKDVQGFYEKYPEAIEDQEVQDMLEDAVTDTTYYLEDL